MRSIKTNRINARVTDKTLSMLEDISETSQKSYTRIIEDGIEETYNKIKAKQKK